MLLKVEKTVPIHPVVPANGMTVGMRSRIRNCVGNDLESVGMTRNGFPEMEWRRNAFLDPEIARNDSECVSGSGTIPEIGRNDSECVSGPGNGQNRSEWVGICFQILIYVGICLNMSEYVGMRCNALECVILLESIRVICLCVDFAPRDYCRD